MLHKIVGSLLTGLALVFFTDGAAFGQSPKKDAYGVLVDNTASLKKQFPDVVLLGKEVVKRMSQRGPVSLFIFKAEEPFAVDVELMEWSPEAKTLNDYVDGLSVVMGQTALTEAIELMADKLDAKVSAERDAFGDKVIILITDGFFRVRRRKDVVWGPQAEEDERRRLTNQLAKRLKESRIKVYAVGLVQELEAGGGFIKKSPREHAESLLKKITKETGGRVVFSKSKSVDADGLLNELFAR